MSVPGANRALALIASLLLLLACACEPAPTPLPSILPTLQPASSEGTLMAGTPAALAPLRYTVAPDALPYLTDADRSLITASAEIVPLDAPPAAEDLGARYEIVVTLSDLLDGTRAPSPLQISLLIDTTLSPLDDPALADILRRAIDLSQIAHALSIPITPTAPSPDLTSLRADLANAGYPDGFDLTLSSPFSPAADALTQVLVTYGIEVRRVTSAPAHLTLTTIFTPNALVLYSLPISYRAVDGLTITFTPSGFPVASR